MKEENIQYIVWADQGQLYYDRNKSLIAKFKEENSLPIIKIMEIKDNVFVIIDDYANIYVYTS